MTSTRFILSLVIGLLVIPNTVAFAVIGTQKTSSVRHESCLNLVSRDDVDLESRRTMLQDVSLASLGLITGSFSLKEVANASGGATAGGAYLLSAKQRYNNRVTAGVTSFLSLGSSLEGGSLNDSKTFFAGDGEGTWKDMSAAGYLLANAFRTSSTKPPDSLPSVQKWKAFAKEVESFQKSVSKNASKGSLAAYQKAEAALDAYLEEVELPPSIEMRK